jgi:hypothetical protein
MYRRSYNEILPQSEPERSLSASRAAQKGNHLAKRVVTCGKLWLSRLALTPSGATPETAPQVGDAGVTGYLPDKQTAGTPLAPLPPLRPPARMTLLALGKERYGNLQTTAPAAPSGHPTAAADARDPTVQQDIDVPQ